MTTKTEEFWKTTKTQGFCLDISRTEMVAIYTRAADTCTKAAADWREKAEKAAAEEKRQAAEAVKQQLAQQGLTPDDLHLATAPAFALPAGMRGGCGGCGGHKMSDKLKNQADIFDAMAAGYRFNAAHIPEDIETFRLTGGEAAAISTIAVSGPEGFLGLASGLARMLVDQGVAGY